MVKLITTSNLVFLLYCFSLQSADAKESHFNLPPGFEALPSPQAAIEGTAIEPPPSGEGDETTTALTEPSQQSAPANETFTLKLSSSSKIYQINNKVHFTVESSQDCYLTVIDIGTSKKGVAVLFPNAYQHNNQIKAREKVDIPSKAMPFDIKVSGPAGDEQVIAICRREDKSLFNTAYDFKSYVFRTLPTEWQEQVTPSTPGQEARTEIKFTVEE